MSGSLPVATLLSPQKDYILLYEVTNDKQLVMSRCSLTDPAKGHVRYDPNNQVGAGPVVMPCRISATFQFGMPFVFGVTYLKVDENNTALMEESTWRPVVAQLSPVIQTIASRTDQDDYAVELATAIVAAIADDTNLWIYYLKRDKLTKQLMLTCAYNDGKSPVSYTTLEGARVIDGSKVAVTGYTVGSDFWRVVFYQEKSTEDGKTYINAMLIRPGGKIAEENLDNTDEAVSGTPLSAVVAGDGTSRKISIYWLSITYKVFKNVGSISAKGNIEWEGKSEVKAANRPNASPIAASDLSVVAGDSTAKANYVFYVQEKQAGSRKDYNYIKDPW